MHGIIARELGVIIPLSYLFACVPFITIASTAPFSINGLGIREALCILFLTPLGASPELAIAFAAIWFAVLTSVNLSSGLLLVFDSPLRHFLRDSQAQQTTLAASKRVCGY